MAVTGSSTILAVRSGAEDGLKLHLEEESFYLSASQSSLGWATGLDEQDNRSSYISFDVIYDPRSVQWILEVADSSKTHERTLQPRVLTVYSLREGHYRVAVATNPKFHHSGMLANTRVLTFPLS